MRKVTAMDRVRYAFDNYMARGTIALIGGLTILSGFVILAAALVVTLAQIRPADAPTESINLFEAMWLSLMRTLDAGTMGGDVGPGFRLVMLLVTLGGIFIISTLIGVLNNGIEDKLDELRKGRSHVIEDGHTVILGWSDQIFSIISELAIANANKPRSVIVVMGEHDKVEMEAEIKDKVGATGRTRVVCRTGSPIDLTDLEIVSPHTARSIIIMAPDAPDPDSHVIKSMLAIINNPNRRPEPYHVVAEIRDPKNVEAARLVGKNEVELVVVGDLISRIIAQTCRQSGLSVVYTELLDFGGDEIYLVNEPALVGKTFGEALTAYEDSTVIGLALNGAMPRLNPPMDSLIGAGDQIIAISEDDDTIKLSGRMEWGIDPAALRVKTSDVHEPERTLIIGWNWRAPAIINELDSYVAPGSAVTVISDYGQAEAEIAHHCGQLKHIALTNRTGNTTDRRTLDSLGITGYQHIIVLSYADKLGDQEADAQTLITLLHMRDIADRAGQELSVVSEMLDLRNRALAEVTRADDFIVSDRLVSLMLSQVSENKLLNAVFTDIFDPEGSEIYLKPADTYVALDQPVNFYTVVAAARTRGEVAIGYRQRALSGRADKAYGVVVNPDKSEKVTFAAGDRIIVIAED